MLPPEVKLASIPSRSSAWWPDHTTELTRTEPRGRPPSPRGSEFPFSHRTPVGPRPRPRQHGSVWKRKAHVARTGSIEPNRVERSVPRPHGERTGDVAGGDVVGAWPSRGGGGRVVLRHGIRFGRQVFNKAKRRRRGVPRSSVGQFETKPAHQSFGPHCDTESAPIEKEWPFRDSNGPSLAGCFNSPHPPAAVQCYAGNRPSSRFSHRWEPCFFAPRVPRRRRGKRRSWANESSFANICQPGQPMEEPP